MEKIDLRKTMKSLYQPSVKGFVLFEVPKVQFVKVDGRGDPNTSQD